MRVGTCLLAGAVWGRRWSRSALGRSGSWPCPVREDVVSCAWTSWLKRCMSSLSNWLCGIVVFLAFTAIPMSSMLSATAGETWARRFVMNGISTGTLYTGRAYVTGSPEWTAYLRTDQGSNLSRPSISAGGMPTHVILLWNSVSGSAGNSAGETVSACETAPGDGAGGGSGGCIGTKLFAFGSSA